MTEDSPGPPPPDPAEVARGFRKLYWSFGLKVVAGLLVFVALWFIPLPSKWLAVPFIALGGWLVLVNLKAIEFLSRAQNAYTHGPEDDTPVALQESGERVLHYTGYVLLFATMIAMIPLGRMVENIVEQTRWILLFGGTGALLAALVLWWAKGRFPFYFRNNEKRAASVLGLVLGTIGLFILLPAWVDRERAMAWSEVRRYALENAGENIKTGSKYLHLYHPGQHATTFRIQVRGNELAAAKGRDSVEVRIGLGDLGFTHVLGVEVGR
mgnify:FL=1